MENEINSYIGKTFLMPNEYGGVLKYDIIAYDEKWNQLICRNRTFYRNYTGFSLKQLKERAIFDKDTFTSEIDRKISEKMKEMMHYNFIDNLDQKNKLFMHNFLGVCEGILNVNSCKDLIEKYKIDNKYEKRIIFYEKEVKRFEKGIRRNKKVLYRILDKNDYEKLEKYYAPNAAENMRKSQAQLNMLIKTKQNVLKAFQEIEV